MSRPAEDCYVCSGVRLLLEIVRRVKNSLKANPTSSRTVTFYEFGSKVLMPYGPKLITPAIRNRSCGTYPPPMLPLNVRRRARTHWRGEQLEVGMNILAQMAQISFGDSVHGPAVDICRGVVRASRQFP